MLYWIAVLSMVGGVLALLERHTATVGKVWRGVKKRKRHRTTQGYANYGQA